MLLILVCLSVFGYESSDYWEGPETYDEFIEYHQIKEVTKTYPELTVVTCEWLTIIEDYVCTSI